MFSNLQKYTFHTYFRYEAFSDYCHSSSHPTEKLITFYLSRDQYQLIYVLLVSLLMPLSGICNMLIFDDLFTVYVGQKRDKNQNFIIVAELVKDAFILAFIEEV